MFSVRIVYNLEKKIPLSKIQKDSNVRLARATFRSDKVQKWNQTKFFCNLSSTAGTVKIGSSVV